MACDGAWAGELVALARKRGNGWLHRANTLMAGKRGECGHGIHGVDGVSWVRGWVPKDVLMCFRCILFKIESDMHKPS